jgi:hypothetical protein
MGGKPLSEEEKDFIRLNCGAMKDSELSVVLSAMANYPRTAGAIRRYRQKLNARRKDKTQVYILLPRNSYEEYKEFLKNNMYLDT